MASITIQATIGEDRQLHITLPEEVQPGPVEVTITSATPLPPLAPGEELTTAQWRERLAAAGLISTARYAPPGTKPLSEEEREELGRLFGGEPSLSDMIIEDRRERWD